MLASCTQTGEQSGGPPTTESTEPPDRKEPIHIENPPGDIAEDLVGAEWVLASPYDYPLPDGTNITLKTDSDKIGGSSGCNSYGGKAIMEEGAFKARDIQSTLKGCKGDVGQREEAYLHALRSSASYQVQDGRLEMQLCRRHGDFAGRLVIEEPPGSENIGFDEVARMVESDVARAREAPEETEREQLEENPSWTEEDATNNVASPPRQYGRSLPL